MVIIYECLHNTTLRARLPFIKNEADDLCFIFQLEGLRTEFFCHISDLPNTKLVIKQNKSADSCSSMVKMKNMLPKKPTNW